MNEFYNKSIISDILEKFKINKIIISGITDTKLINSIIKYDATFIQINTNDPSCISDNPLNVLQKLDNYDAIFIDDDANWYTVINELKIINDTNKEFPLVFICNNNYPNKKRDSYYNPASIPSEFRQEYTKELPIYFNDEKIIISDGLYHACEENTAQNGVLTAIEDFLNENSHIGMIKVNLNREIYLLYFKTQINQKRISIIHKTIQNEKIENPSLSDKLIENQLLISYIKKYKLYDKNLIDLETEISNKDNTINYYENKIKSQSNKLTYKDSKINGLESNLSLKDSQLKNIESKLVNKNRNISNLENQLKTTTSNLNSLTKEVDQKNNEITDLENQLKTTTSNLNSLTKEVDQKNNEITDLENQLKTANSDFDFLIEKITETADEFTQRESDYNRKINHKNNNENELLEQIKIKDHEIEDLHQDLNKTETELANQKIISSEQIKQKDNHLKIKQNELNEEKKKSKSYEHSYRKNLSKLDNKEYCINCYKQEISNNQIEIEYYKNNGIIKKILIPLGYLFLILKSNSNEISLNMKLYKFLKNSKCFDIGFYLNKNKDLINSKWCKYFSPELHYICNGFDENRTFNKKYFNRNSKKELLEYLLNCEG